MKIKNILVGGALAFVSILSLAGCSTAKVEPEPAVTQKALVNNDMVSNDNINLVANSNQDKKLTCKNAKIEGLSFSDFNVTAKNNDILSFSTEVSNKTTDTIVLTKDDIKVKSGNIEFENLFNEIKIFEDECINVSFDVKGEFTTLDNLEITVLKNSKHISFK